MNKQMDMGNDEWEYFKSRDIKSMIFKIKSVSTSLAEKTPSAILKFLKYYLVGGFTLL